MNNEPTYRMFISKDDYITLKTHETDSKRWTKSGIESVLSIQWWRFNNQCVIAGNKKSKDTIVNYIKASGNSTNSSYALDWICKHQLKIREARLIKRDKKITDPIDERMATVPQLPEDFEQWIHEEALYKSRYLFYEYSRKKVTKGYCSWCKSWVEVSDIKHNTIGHCPNCNSDVTFKAMNKQKNVSDGITALLLQKVDNQILVRKFRARRYFDKAENQLQPFQYNEHFHEINRLFYDLDGNPQDGYIWDNFKQRGNRWCKGDYWGRESGVLYTMNIEEILQNTIYQYSGLKAMAESHHAYEVNVYNFLESYPTEKYFEYLIKYKLCNIARDILSYSSGYYGHCYSYRMQSPKDRVVNINGTDISQLLMIQKHDLHFLREADANLTGLEFLQYCRKQGIKPVVDQIKQVQEQFDGRLSYFTYFLKYTTVHKAIKFISIITGVGGYKQRAELWKDYLEMCKQLKYDLKNDFVLFPRDLKLRHDQCVTEINAINEKKRLKEENKKNKAIADMYQELKMAYSYENKNYMIVVPTKASDIILEGQALHHCVGTYTTRVAKRESIILFIREKENPETSFYTMEIKNGKVNQVRGKYNNAMTSEVKGFVESFKSKLKPKKEAV